MKAIHVELPDEGGYVGMFKVLPIIGISYLGHSRIESARLTKVL